MFSSASASSANASASDTVHSAGWRWSGSPELHTDFLDTWQDRYAIAGLGWMFMPDFQPVEAPPNNIPASHRYAANLSYDKTKKHEEGQFAIALAILKQLLGNMPTQRCRHIFDNPALNSRQKMVQTLAHCLVLSMGDNNDAVALLQNDLTKLPSPRTFSEAVELCTNMLVLRQKRRGMSQTGAR